MSNYYDPKKVQILINGQSIGEPDVDGYFGASDHGVTIDRGLSGFTVSVPLAPAVHTVTTTFGSAYIEAMWSEAEAAGNLRAYIDLQDAQHRGEIDRFEIWTLPDGSTWALAEGQGVMVVKPEVYER